MKRYTHDSDVSDLLGELTASRKWQRTFGTKTKPQKDSAHAFLTKLAKEFQACRNKEMTKEINDRAKALNQPIKIGGTMKGSSIAFQGTTPESFKTRTDAARAMGRISSYGAEKRRILSIVAQDFPETMLTEVLGVPRVQLLLPEYTVLCLAEVGYPHLA